MKGLSTTTCRPARNAAAASSWWTAFGAATTTSSTAASSNSSSTVATTGTEGRSLCTLSGSLETTARSRNRGSAPMSGACTDEPDMP